GPGGRSSLPTRRSSDLPSLVAAFGADFVRGQQDANVATVAKHFPGHGSVDSDSHKQLPVLTENEAQLVKGLEPFEAAMKVGLDRSEEHTSELQSRVDLV